MDGMLSQDEINALFGNNDAASDSKDDAQTAADHDITLTDSEKDAVGEISNICMGTAATTLSSLLNQRVDITTPHVSISTWDDLARQYDRPCVMMQISYKEGIDGNNVLILRENDVKIITDLMMGGPGNADPNEELTDLHLSAIGEAMNQMMGSAATSMSSMFNRKIDISPPVSNLVEVYNNETEDLPDFLKGKFVEVMFKLTIGTLIDSSIMQLYPIDFAHELVNMFSVDTDNSVSNDAPAAASQPAQAQQPQPAPQPTPQPQPQPVQQPMMQQPMYNNYAPQPDVNVQPAAFQPFAGDLSALSQKENIDLIMDVPLEVTVELGRTSKTIKDILEFAPGTIIELNKIAGESVDVLVNGKNVAKGEVVVIEENFGVRITEIIKEQ
ncbi:MAG: flagellar motor switch phosphatase FliY [[Bacteroides] pectinophilus]|nr:flagellar motor switch phosphatase FliY [[Bacteroides] pectinophilus]